ncbi:MAG TPA: hypothetical protein VF119_08930, partial [Candidatus Limnocylindrales bacterium]
WPADTPTPRAQGMVEDFVWLMVVRPTSDEAATASVSMMQVAPDGTTTQGVEETTENGSAFAVGPDGIGYQVRQYDWSATDPDDVTSEITAFDHAGVRPGWPVTIQGNASAIAFDEHGLVHVAVGSPSSGPTRVLVLDKDGREQPFGPDELPITSSATWAGAGDLVPGAPIVSDGGRVYLVDTVGGDTRVLGLSSRGDRLTGWPYRSPAGMGWTGYCGEGDTGCGHQRTMPVVGRGGTLYLVHAPSSRSTGGSLVAIGAQADVRSGWPVGLKRAGAEFWSVVANPAGGAWALAIEPERRAASATILSIADDSTIRWSTTILEP